MTRRTVWNSTSSPLELIGTSLDSPLQQTEPNVAPRTHWHKARLSALSSRPPRGAQWGPWVVIMVHANGSARPDPSIRLVTRALSTRKMVSTSCARCLPAERSRFIPVRGVCIQSSQEPHMSLPGHMNHRCSPGPQSRNVVTGTPGVGDLAHE